MYDPETSAVRPLDETEFEAFLSNLISQCLRSEESLSHRFDPHRHAEMTRAQELFDLLLERSGHDGGSKLELHQAFRSGAITAEADCFDVCGREDLKTFGSLLSLANTVSFTPLAGGLLDVSLTFNGLLVPEEQE